MRKYHCCDYQMQDPGEGLAFVFHGFRNAVVKTKVLKNATVMNDLQQPYLFEIHANIACSGNVIFSANAPRGYTLHPKL